MRIMQLRRLSRTTASASRRQLIVRIAPMAQLAVTCRKVVTEPANAPTLPRSGACSTTLPAWHPQDMVVFGGYVEDSNKERKATNEAWTFAVATGKWSALEYAPGPVPRSRLVGQVAVVGDYLWLIGGWDPAEPGTGGEILADVWKLNLRTRQWEEVKVQGEPLEPISRFQAVAVGERIFIHTHRSLEDILVLDTAAKGGPTLLKLPVKGFYPDEQSPASRGLHSMTAVDGSLYLFGGAPQKGPMMDDLWRLDLAGMTWRQLHPEGPRPHARCSHAAAAVGKHILFFGGAFYAEGGGLVMSDTMFVLDTEHSRWVFPSVRGELPSPRNAHVISAVGTDVIIHGGWKAFQESYNDTYILNILEGEPAGAAMSPTAAVHAS